MGRSAKKIDGRSKEARAPRAKKLAKASPAPRVSAAKRSVDSAKRLPRKPRASRKPVEPSFDRETSLRILALQIASSNIGRDTAPRDLVPLARQIEEFLTGGDTQAAIAGRESFMGCHGMNAADAPTTIAEKNDANIYS